MGGNCSLGLNASNPDAKRIAGWAKVPGAMLQCYPQFDWRDEFAPVVGGGANADGSATLKTGAGISGGRTSMELHASTDWMPSILSVVLNGVSADPTSADRVPWTAVLDEAEPPFQLVSRR